MRNLSLFLILVTILACSEKRMTPPCTTVIPEEYQIKTDGTSFTAQYFNGYNWDYLSYHEYPTLEPSVFTEPPEYATIFSDSCTAKLAIELHHQALIEEAINVTKKQETLKRFKLKR